MSQLGVSGALRARLAAYELDLDVVPSARGRYLPAAVDGDRLWVSGHTGRTAAAAAVAGNVPDEVDVAAASRSAQQAAANLVLAAVSVVSEDRIRGVVALRGYVRARPDFGDHPTIIDAASEVLEAAFGGGHARAAIGVASLPGGACVELEAVLALA